MLFACDFGLAGNNLMSVIVMSRLLSLVSILQEVH